MHIRRVENAVELEACITIRRRVFIDEQGVPEEDELDGLDVVCRHFLAAESRDIPPTDAFGTARLAFLDEEHAKAQRVAVLKEHRRKGVGNALMFALEGEAARAGRPVVVLASQLSAVPFYEALGYQPYGDVFLDAKIEHRMMRKRVMG